MALLQYARLHVLLLSCMPSPTSNVESEKLCTLLLLFLEVECSSMVEVVDSSVGAGSADRRDTRVGRDVQPSLHDRGEQDQI